MRRWYTAFLVCSFLLAGCSRSVSVEGSPGPAASGSEPTSSASILSALEVDQPAGWLDDLALPIAEDLNPDPHVVEVELEARITEMEIVPGHMTPVWTYNGTLPGPMIRAKVGDRVIVHFRNDLPDPTSIHWHGIRVPNDMDGVPGVTQERIQPGGEFTYDFVIRDAGTFWYHPHAESVAQVGRGLYAPFIVEDPEDPEVFGDDLVLMLSDMSLDARGKFLPLRSGGAFGDLFGREGSVLLVNGKVMPTLKVRKGKQQRWRIINAARSRFYTIRYGFNTLIRLGGDNGLAARSKPVRDVVVVPGERADLVFTPPDAPGTKSVLEWHPTERGYGTTFNRSSEPMMAIHTVDESPVRPEPIPEFLREIEPIDTAGAMEVDIDLAILSTYDDVAVMGINGIDGRTLTPDDPSLIEVNVGETWIWRITNDTDFAHPFHLHGFSFQVLDDDRTPEWKDTVDVPAKSELRIAIRFEDRPGVWMYHCHILDHADLGMMALLRVTAGSTSPAWRQ